MALLDRIRDEYRDAVTRLLDEPFNFMKHGQRDPNAELTIYDPIVNGIFLFLLCRDYLELFSEMVPEISIFMATYGTLNPHLLKPSANSAFDVMLTAVQRLAETDQLDLKSAGVALANFDAGVAAAKRLGLPL
jgi:hypothetical protein